MKILIVHDRREIADQLEQTCKESTNCSVEIAVDFVTAKEMLRQSLYDLLVLDLTIPYRMPGICDYQYAQNLLEDIYVDDNIYPPGDVIALSREEPAIASIAKTVSNSTATLILEDAVGHWKTTILEKVRYISRSAKGRSLSLAQLHAVDVLLICAMDEEFEPVKAAFELNPDSMFPAVYHFVFNDKSGSLRSGVACSVGKQGQAAAASFSQALISWFRPRLALMVGICGGVTGKADLCDVMISESVFDWDSGKFKTAKGDEAASPRWLSARPDPVSIQGSAAHLAARRLQADGVRSQRAIEKRVSELTGGQITKVSIRLVPTASGGSVVAEQRVVDKVLEINDRIAAVDMEAYGFYYAAKFAFVVKPQVLCIKGVSDHCNVAKGDSFHEAAAFASVQVARDLLLTEWDF